ncbi:MAG: carbohydrate kinase, partial [Thermotoga sp.]|nr:carbohydrate kinase [Thermotoga sp.]
MITFIGHVSKDINVVGEKKEVVGGGGVVHGAITSALFGVRTFIVTKCAEEDIPLFSFLKESGVQVKFLDSSSTTSIENVYGSSPDERESFLVAKADPFTKEDLDVVSTEIVHINPLWYGEFPEELIPVLRERVRFLSADAQGFLRVEESGKLVYKDWEHKDYLSYFDLFKVDV